jgi:hypothetical protein
MARKPLVGTVAVNVLRYGTGALNIDATRIPTGDGDYDHPGNENATASRLGFGSVGRQIPPNALGRWPANVILTDPIFDGGVEGVVGGGATVPGGQTAGQFESRSGFGGGVINADYHDSGTYSRFYLIPKADRADREPVLGGLPTSSLNAVADYQPLIPRCECGPVGMTLAQTGHPKCGHPREMWKWVPGKPKARANLHPTVKPTDLMRHLVRLVTPPGGTVLDPFLGSGTTALAAELEGFPWLGIEREAEYVAIAEARLNGTQRGLGLSA